MTVEKLLKTILLYIILIIGVSIFIAPFYFVIINSLKTNSEYLVSKLVLPSSFYLDNYVATIEMMKYGKTLLNSIIITAFSVFGILVIASMAAYKIARTKGILNTILFFLFLSVFVVPFQSVMIPIVVMARRLSLMNKLYGMVLVYLGLVSPTAIFLYRGFIQTIPLSLEECAQIDGASVYQIFFRIVLPLLKPITSTIIILLGLQIWNDFLLPLLMLQTPKNYTLPLATMRFFQTYNTAWGNILAATVLSSIPMIILFFSAQKQIVQGVTSGAIKG
ncbi:carbohydrate ABC transporter permease [Sediminispirochaeta bajacaliforniensis]|uniref:carbohydrate ABC transporter permease n=1 Tax=Sediminispirochaeta bajacaliforniensis TaxID=148 RepID=UPI00035C0C4C|nr:carbohydrate ABC transporter permease [Sediminispirochaeta bajacaliforniensis]